jgi:hypothetical protein
VVTEKDAVKLDLPPDAPLRVVVLGVEPKLRKPDQLLSMVEACLRVGPRNEGNRAAGSQRTKDDKST